MLRRQRNIVFPERRRFTQNVELCNVLTYTNKSLEFVFKPFRVWAM